MTDRCKNFLQTTPFSTKEKTLFTVKTRPQGEPVPGSNRTLKMMQASPRGKKSKIVHDNGQNGEPVKNPERARER